MPITASFPAQVSPESPARELDERLSRRRNDADADDVDNAIVTISILPRLGTRNTGSTASSTSLSFDPSTSSDNAKRDAMSSLHFLALQNATTCESYSFSWLYDGPVPNANLAFPIVQSPLRKS